MILADTGIWVDYFGGRNAGMRRLLENGQIVMHPFIVAELALGYLQDRRRTLAQLESLRAVTVARLPEVRHMIETHSLYSKGIGLTAAHLVASCLLTQGTQLWTRDAALKNVASLLAIPANLP